MVEFVSTKHKEMAVNYAEMSVLTNINYAFLSY